MIEVHTPPSDCGSAQKVTPFHSLNDAHGAILKLVDRIEHLSNKLVGSVPEGKSSAATPSAAGLLGAVREVSHIALGRIGAAHAALDRIESELP